MRHLQPGLDSPPPLRWNATPKSKAILKPAVGLPSITKHYRLRPDVLLLADPSLRYLTDDGQPVPRQTILRVLPSPEGRKQGDTD